MVYEMFMIWLVSKVLWKVASHSISKCSNWFLIGFVQGQICSQVVFHNKLVPNGKNSLVISKWW